MTLTELNTEQLIALCKAGKQAAQMELYNRYYKAMYNTSFRIVKNSFEAEDIMQDSFLIAFTKLENLKEVKMFGAWLKRIVINNSINHYAKKSKIKEIPLNDVLYKVEDHLNNSDYDFTNIKAQKVLNTLESLKDNYRIALTLHLIEGYDYEEISHIMNISSSNCRTLIFRAKDSLKNKLQTLLISGQTHLKIILFDYQQINFFRL